MLLPDFLDRFALRTLHVFGYTLIKRQKMLLATDRRTRLLKSHSIDLVIDVGANTGQYAKSLRKLGYLGRIVSFEPMRSAFHEMSLFTRSDMSWEAYPFGLGESEGYEDLHISENSISSSILPMLSEHEKFAPKSRFTGTEKIHIRKLDDIFKGISENASNIWLKLDVQGYEDRVLRGAEASIRRIKMVQIELSFRPLYANQESFVATIASLHDLGFDLVGIEPGFMDYSTGELLQADGIFLRRIR